MAEITALRKYPCPECGGAGEIHCCEGLQVQPGGTDEAAAVIDPYPYLSAEELEPAAGRPTR